VNPLKLLRALHAGFQNTGGRYAPHQRVVDIVRSGQGYTVETAEGERFGADRIVIACGHGVPELSAKVGLHCPIRPQRGQILVTERMQEILPLPLGSIRQTDEGSILLGVSHEEVGFDDGTAGDVVGAIAARAARILPDLANVNIVRSWGALRIMPPDGCPIYDESETWPGVFMATNHSGVTLAGVHARYMPDWILRAQTPVGFQDFSVKRFEGTEHAAPPV
jgi:glycine/D-amino acid oxidase-like deaminating enzyme